MTEEDEKKEKPVDPYTIYKRLLKPPQKKEPEKRVEKGK